MPLKGLRVGAAIGYAHGDFDGDNGSGSGGIDSYQGLLYGRYDHGRFFFADAQAGYAFNTYDMSRGFAFGTINRTASSDADGHDVSAQLRIGANSTRAASSSCLRRRCATTGCSVTASPRPAPTA